MQRHWGRLFVRQQNLVDDAAPTATATVRVSGQRETIVPKEVGNPREFLLVHAEAVPPLAGPPLDERMFTSISSLRHKGHTVPTL